MIPSNPVTILFAAFVLSFGAFMVWMKRKPSQQATLKATMDFLSEKGLRIDEITTTKR